MKLTFFVLSLPLFIIMAGCQEERNLPTDTSSPLRGQSSGVTYLPYGEPAPDVLPPNTVPEPYDVNRHGSPLPNMIPHLNLAHTPDKTVVHQRAFGRGLQSSGSRSLIPAQGFLSKQGPTWTSTDFLGIYGAHNTQLSMEVADTPTPSDSFVLFAPTSMPAGSSCIEMSTVHRHYPNDTGTVHRAGWWDWCSDSTVSSFDIEEDMTNTTWKSWYTRTDGLGNRFYYMSITYDGSQGYPCWNGMIYNYNFGYWESKIYRCYGFEQTHNWTGNGNDGWSLWEWRDDKQCPDLARTAAYNLRAWSQSTGWVNLQQAAPPPLASGNGCWLSQSSWSMDYTSNGTAADWFANTP